MKMPSEADSERSKPFFTCPQGSFHPLAVRGGHFNLARYVIHFGNRDHGYFHHLPSTQLLRGASERRYRMGESPRKDGCEGDHGQ
jgi:hypothetical protein